MQAKNVKATCATGTKASPNSQLREKLEEYNTTYYMLMQYFSQLQKANSKIFKVTPSYGKRDFPSLGYAEETRSEDLAEHADIINQINAMITRRTKIHAQIIRLLDERANKLFKEVVIHSYIHKLNVRETADLLCISKMRVNKMLDDV